MAILQPELAGLYHCVSAGETNWLGYARFVLQNARALGVTLKVGPEQIAPVDTQSYPTPAKRPLNSRLDTAKLQKTFGFILPHWQLGVARMLKEHLS
jgi:dTDP-4-dehydrorhamnose reductase